MNKLKLSMIRDQFPIYQHYPDLVYLDSSATSLKPQCVLDAMNEYYEQYGVNIHRGVYQLSYLATDAYDKAREKIAKFLNAKFEEIVFVRNASEALNLVALTYGRCLKKNDVIITSELEHHSSVLPWMKIAEEKGATLKYIPLNSEGRITVEAFKEVMDENVKVVALTLVSNVMGYVTPLEEIISIAHQYGAVVVADAAQAIAHMPIDVEKLDADFLAFSAHKMCGPTGVGVLYGKAKILKKLEPLYYGGDMNEDVAKDSVEVKDIPSRFETGTPAIAEAIGLAKAIEFIEAIGYDNIQAHTKMLHQYAIEKLEKINNITIYNKDADKAIIAFNINGVHPHDAATLFDERNICLRAGHHCAQLITKWLACIGTLRASFYFYNTTRDVDAFVQTVKDAVDFFERINGDL